jgi:hypothetical protein
MRRAHFDWGFMTQTDGTLVGACLGYDRCAEHEDGVKGLYHAFGIPEKETPLGVADRQATQVPTGLVFAAYSAKPRDKRRRAYPAAYLAVADSFIRRELVANPREALARVDAGFIGEMTDKDHKPHYDLACSWDRCGFVLHVRGEENVVRLRELHEAILRKDVAMGLPWARAFVRGGPALVIVSQVTPEEHEKILARDTASKKLIDAANATGIHDELKAAGRRWYALSPDWLDPEAQDEVMFYLNPWEQSQYNSGWFTVDELRAWCRNEGVVVKDPALVAFKAANRDFGYNLVGGMKAQDLYLRVHEVFTWADEAKTVVGARLLMAKKSQAKMPSGVYPAEELMRQFPPPDAD